MNYPVDPRDRCMSQLREITRKDAWLERVALFFALELLDLEQLNQVARYAQELEGQPHPEGTPLANALRKERFF
jgi:hypothetical protein